MIMGHAIGKIMLIGNILSIIVVSNTRFGRKLMRESWTKRVSILVVLSLVYFVVAYLVVYGITGERLPLW
jgi:hypothetical protein